MTAAPPRNAERTTYHRHRAKSGSRLSTTQMIPFSTPSTRKA